MHLMAVLATTEIPASAASSAWKLGSEVWERSLAPCRFGTGTLVSLYNMLLKEPRQHFGWQRKLGDEIVMQMGMLGKAALTVDHVLCSHQCRASDMAGKNMASSDDAGQGGR